MRALNRHLVIALAVASLGAAEPTVPPAAGGEVDPITRRRAEEALRNLAAPAETAPPAVADPALVERIQAVEAWLRECAILVDAGEMSAAGERFLKAAETLRGLSAEERQALGKRYRAAADRLGGFARGFAEAAGPVAGDPAPAPAQP